MPETTCYILDGKTPVPCHDMDVWQQFMDDIPKRTVAFDIVGTFQIRTTFMGVNIGTAIAPKFFKMTVVGGNKGDPPIWTESWKRAEANHRGMVHAAEGSTEFLEKVMSGDESALTGYKFIAYEVLPDELRFLMKSEQVAIKAQLTSFKGWDREGATLIFRSAKNSAADCD